MKNRSHRRNINRTRLRHGDFAKYKNIFHYDVVMCKKQHLSKI